jgi:hypothetical protein
MVMVRVARTSVIIAKKIVRKPAIIGSVAAKTMVYSVFPSTMNDVLVHHAHLDLDEVFHSVQDSFVLSAAASCIKAFSDL